MKNLLRGKRAELLAKKYLQRKGLTFVAQNFRTHFGELDLVFVDHGTTVFVEVKARRNPTLGLPEEAVNRKKLLTLTKLGELFLARYPNLPQRARIDVVAIDLSRVQPAITHIENVSG